MTYSRQLNLSEDVEKALKDWLDQELTSSESERKEFVDRNTRYQRDYWAEPSKEVRTFPFRGAASIMIPLTAISVEAIHARVMTMLFGLRQFVSVKCKSDQWDDAAPAYEKFMDWELLHNLKYRDNIESAHLEITKLGTGIGKVGYERQYRYIVVDDGGTENVQPVVVKQGASVGSTAVNRFCLPFYARTREAAPWVAEEYSWNYEQAESAATAGLINPDVLPLLKSWCWSGNGTGVGEQADVEVDDMTRTTPTERRTFTWYEIHTAFAIAAPTFKYPIQIVIGYHKETRTLLYVRHNKNQKGDDPYEIGKYFPLEHRWFGIGVAKQSEQFQKEITTQHRQRLDAGTIANMQMFKVSRQSGYGPKEPIFPGKMWFLDDMSHVEMMTMNEVKASSYNNENMSSTYHQQRVGVNELTLGMPQTGTPGTASAELARVQEGRRKFDYIYANVKDFNKRLIAKIAATIQQYGERRVEYFNLTEDGNLVREYLDQPVEYVSDALIFDINTAGEQENKLLDRQNWVQLSQMIQAYYTSLIQLAMQFGQSEDAMTIYERAKVAATEAMKQILQTYDVRNEDRIIIKEFLNVLKQPTPTAPGAATAQLAGLGNPLQALSARSIPNFAGLLQAGS